MIEIIIDNKGKIIKHNNKLLSLLNLKKTSLINQSINSIIPNSYSIKSDFEKSCKKVIKNKKSGFKTILKRQNGAYLPIVALADKIIENNTELIRIDIDEKQINCSNDLFLSFYNLIENSDDFIAIIDKNGYIEHINSKGAELIEYSSEELIGNKNFNVQQISPNLSKKLIKSIAYGESFEQETELIRKNSTRFIAKQRIIKINDTKANPKFGFFAKHIAEVDNLSILIISDSIFLPNGLKSMIEEIKSFDMIETSTKANCIFHIDKQKIIFLHFKDYKNIKLELINKIKNLAPSATLIVIIDVLDKNAKDICNKNNLDLVIDSNISKNELEVILNKSLDANFKLQHDKNLNFTNREKDIISLMAKGLAAKEIGSMLNISPKTVNRHKENIYKKAGVNSAFKLINLVSNKI